MPTLTPDDRASGTPKKSSKVGRDRACILGYNPVVLYALIAIIVLGVISQIALRKIYQRQETFVQNHLQTTLRSLDQLLSTWQRQHAGSIQVITNSSKVRPLLLNALRDKGPLSASDLLDEQLYPLMQPLGYEGYSVFTSDYTLVASSSRAYVGTQARRAQTMEALVRAEAGLPAITAPLGARRTLDGPTGTMPVGTLLQLMCVTVPGSEGVSLAGYFCFRFNPYTGFFPIFASVASGETGEVYAIDKEGNIITPSRFLPEPSTYLSATVPGTNPQHLTLAAQRLLQDKHFQTDSPYSDYRGVRVVGAGHWLESMNIGLIAEQDYEEAFASYLAARDVIIALTLSASLLLVLLCASSVIHRRALEIRESRFRSLLENIPTPVYMKSLDGRITVLNSSFCEMVGQKAADLLRAETPSQKIPDWLAPLFDGDTDLDSARSIPQTVELERPDGEQCFYRLVRFPVFLQHSDRSQAVATIIVDDTERTTAVRQLSDVNLHLEKLVEERTHELWQAKETAVAASKTKADFLANMSHEIRTPLNAVLGLAHLSLNENLPAKVRNYLMKIQDSGRHLLQVINDILDFSRIEAGKMQLDQRDFELRKLLDSVVDLVWDKAVTKGLEIKVTVDPRLPRFLNGDSLRLGQVLINFMANAVKFTEQGKVTLTASLDESSDCGHVPVVFAVEDTGIGIEPDKLSVLFQPFHQVDNSSKRRFQGSGLGLAICRNLADLMGGTVSVESSPSVGSCFRLNLCLKPGTTTPVASPAPAANLPKVKCRVLVVEDDALNREIIESFLLDFGAQVVSAADGAKALELFAQETFDVVLMDMQMPSMDGLETATQIRALPKGAHVPIIAVTANALPGDREHYLSQGINDYLAKPLDAKELHALLLRWQPFSPETLTSADSLDSLRKAGVNTTRALHHMMNNKELYHRMLKRFVTERQDLPQQLNDALQAGEMGQLRDLVHSLHSIAAALGLDQLADYASRQEQVIVSSKGTLDIDGLNTQFRRDLTLLRAWLDQAGIAERNNS